MRSGSRAVGVLAAAVLTVAMAPPLGAASDAVVGAAEDIRFEVRVKGPLRTYGASILGSQRGFLLVGRERRGAGGSYYISHGSADGATWRSTKAADPAVRFYGVAGGGRTWVAMSHAADRGVQVFASRDGVRWGLVRGPATLDHANAFELVGGPQGFAITGQLGRADDYVTTAWISSPDGRQWTEASWLRGKDVHQIVPLPGAFLAIAWNRAYISRTGSTWAALPTQALGPIGTSNGFGAPAIVVERDGTILALRHETPGPRTLWLGRVVDDLADGPRIEWRRLAQLEELARGVQFSTAVPGPVGGFLVVGFDRQLNPVSLTSVDGEAWVRAAIDPRAFDGGVPWQVASSRRGYVAVGWNVNSAGRAAPDLWWSDDGVAWRPTGEGLIAAPPPAPTGPCPPRPQALVRDWAAWPEAALPGCFGDAEIRLTGYVADCGGCGGTGPTISTVPWLLSAPLLGMADFWLVPERHRSWSYSGVGRGVPVHLDPGFGLKAPGLGAKVAVVGHFNDPASAACRLLPVRGVMDGVVPSSMTVPLCERAFAVTRLTVLDP